MDETVVVRVELAHGGAVRGGAGPALAATAPAGPGDAASLRVPALAGVRLGGLSGEGLLLV